MYTNENDIKVKITEALAKGATDNEIFFLEKILDGSLNANFDDGNFIYCGKEKNPQLRHTGYYEIIIQEDCTRHTILAHRLMVMCKIKDIIPNGLEVDHLDEDKSNNRASNLETVTPAENARRRCASQKQQGFKFGVAGCRITAAELLDELAAGKTASEIAIKYGYPSPVPVYHRIKKARCD